MSLPLARDFNETVAMDLKHWDKNIWFLHLIDLATRFSVSSVITSKHKEVVLNKILLIWIGNGLVTPSKFIADNGGEFANEDHMDMAENLDITKCNATGESPWSNGLCEQNHAVIDEMVHKIKADAPECDLDVALTWACHAKNSLQMVHR